MGILKILSNNNKGIDAKEAESKLRGEHPSLLGANEHIELAFKCEGDGRDKNYFTSHRILFRNGKGIGSKRKNYLSIPYSAIQGFAVQTAGGSFLDKDTELKIWYDVGGGKKTMDFKKESVDLFEVKQYFNHKVFPQTGTQLTSTTAKLQDFSTTEGYIKQATNVESIFNWLGNDAVQVSPQQIQDRFGFGAPSPVLMPGEQVEIAYQARRDLIILTPSRLLLVDVKGFSGKKIEFFSLRWDFVKAFTVETAGSFDLDGHFIIHTSIPHKKSIRQDLREGRTDIFQLHMAFSNKLLGGGSPSDLVPGIDQRKGHVDPGPKLFGGSNNRPLDASEVERMYRSNPCLLQSDEYVEMAFRGYRDLVIFTTKRIIDIDVKGWSGKKIEFNSIPYSSLLAFAVKTAGKHDRDSEVVVYTEIMHDPPPNEEEGPQPGMSCLEWDFNKNAVDILELKRYLNARILATERGVRVPTGLLAAATKEHGMDKLLSRWGDDQRVIDANELDRYLHTDVDVLLDDENVVMAFKAGRDISCFTNKRVFIIDKKGWSGKKIAYVSLPYSSIKAFSAESAGSWDRDSTVTIFTKNHWDLTKVYLDFRKGKADIVAIQNFLSAIILGSEQDAANFLKTVNSNTVKINHVLPMNSFTDWVIDFSVEVDPKVADAQLHSDPPILLDDEHVEKAYAEGRDLWVYTNLRILYADVKGMSGKKVKYTSIPFNKNSVNCFAVETVGHLDVDAECFMYTNIPAKSWMMQKLLVKMGDIMEMHEYLGNRLLFDTKQKAVGVEQHPGNYSSGAGDAYAPSNYSSGAGNAYVSGNNSSGAGDAYVPASDYDPYAKYG